MKLKCRISGLSFSLGTESLFHDVLSYGIHPIFSCTYDQLVLIGENQWADMVGMSEKEIRLFTLALMNTSGLVNWKAPASSEFSIALCYESIPLLLELNSFIHSRSRAIVIDRYLPRLVITTDPDNTDMKVLKSWLTGCFQSIAEYWDGREAIREQERKKESREALTRIIARSGEDSSRYAAKLANWAAIALDFPKTRVDIGGGKEMTCCAYWKHIIECAGTANKDFRLFTIAKNDIIELEDWVLDKINLEVDNILGLTLIRLLKHALDNEGFFGLSNFEIRAQIEADSVYRDMPTLEKPIREQFSSLVDYLKADALYKSQLLAHPSNKEDS